MKALKSIHRYLTTVQNNGPTYTNNGPLKIERFSDPDYAADLDTRRSISGILVKVSKGKLMCVSSRNQL